MPRTIKVVRRGEEVALYAARDANRPKLGQFYSPEDPEAAIKRMVAAGSFQAFTRQRRVPAFYFASASRSVDCSDNS
jgi:hypothetical protein